MLIAPPAWVYQWPEVRFSSVTSKSIELPMTDLYDHKIWCYIQRVLRFLSYTPCPFRIDRSRTRTLLCNADAGATGARQGLLTLQQDRVNGRYSMLLFTRSHVCPSFWCRTSFCNIWKTKSGTWKDPGMASYHLSFVSIYLFLERVWLALQVSTLHRPPYRPKRVNILSQEVSVHLRVERIAF